MLSWRLSYNCCAACAYCLIVCWLMLKEKTMSQPAGGSTVETAAQPDVGVTEAKCDSAPDNDTIRDALPPIPALITAKRF